MAFSRLALAAALLTTAAPLLTQAQARFDLPGPTIDIRVTRAGTTLPIAAVPTLQPGDTLFIHPDLPPTQSVHYLLIAVFLRGTTNPPPQNWFTRVETWDKKIREEGISIPVPEEAQQAVLFLAPETGGDFATLRSAVQGRPGVFVRAAQDLTEAGFEQSRVDTYLAAIQRVPPTDPAALVKHSDLLARTLNLKPNADCFKRPPDQQYTCLTQTGTASLLDDGHGNSLLTALSSGSGSDFINQASTTRLAAGGNYSAYVGALVDFTRILSSLHTAQYQYIPALATPAAEAFHLRLNTPPSFHNPKSVIVIGLPAIQKAVAPPLRPAEPDHISCLLDPHVALPIEGAPLVFTTAFAHDLTLHLNLPGKATDLPLTPDAYQGGLILGPPPTTRKELPLEPVDLPKAANTERSKSTPKPAVVGPDKSAPPPEAGSLTGTIQGYWGFDKFTGPTIPLQNTPGTNWHLEKPDIPLLAGQSNQLELVATATACLQSITDQDAKPIPYTTTDATSVKLTLRANETPGNINIAIHQYGERPGTLETAHLETRTFALPARIDSIQIHAEDRTATLTGTSLDQVSSVHLAAALYNPTTPGALLTLTTPPFHPGEKLTATVTLKDGRTLQIATTILPERPEVTLLSRRATLPTPSPIQLTTPADLPLGATLKFFLKSKGNFPRTGQIEIANADSSLHTTLTLAAGTLILQDPHTLLATFDPLKLFGPSTFGPFRYRAVMPDDNPGDWQPLATIVRLPTLTTLTCSTPTAPCTLTGDNLYLLDSLAPTIAFLTPTPVPEGFIDPTLLLQHPTISNQTATFYLKLRDDPATTQTANLPITK